MLSKLEIWMYMVSLLSQQNVRETQGKKKKEFCTERVQFCGNFSLTGVTLVVQMSFVWTHHCLYLPVTIFTYRQAPRLGSESPKVSCCLQRRWFFFGVCFLSLWKLNTTGERLSTESWFEPSCPLRALPLSQYSLAPQGRGEECKVKPGWVKIRRVYLNSKEKQ